MFKNNREPGSESGANRVKSHKTGRDLRVVADCLLLLVLIAIAGLILTLVRSRQAGNVPALSGYRVLVVAGGSMSPALKPGSLLLVQATDPEMISVGEIISYRDPQYRNLFITHRVTGFSNVGNRRFVTRGDANECPDPQPIEAAEVIGKVVGYLPYAGYLVHCLQTPSGLFLTIILPCLLIILLEIKNLFKHRIFQK